MKDDPLEIQSGQFAREWVLEKTSQRDGFLAMRKRDARHPIERWGEGDAAQACVWIKPTGMTTEAPRVRLGGASVASRGWPLSCPRGQPRCIMGCMGCGGRAPRVCM